MAKSARTPKVALSIRQSADAHTERKPPAALREPHGAEVEAGRVDAWSGASRQLVRKITLRRLKQFRALEPKLLQRDRPKVIHDFRVASRRLQQDLDLLFPKPRPSRLRKLRRCVRKSRSALSEVRNCDVLLKRAEKALRRKRLAKRDVWEAFQKYLSRRREKRFSKAAARIGRLNLPDCFVELRSYLQKNAAADPASGSRGAESPARPFRETVVQVLRQHWEALQECLEDAQRKPSATALHAIRIAVKRLRYLAEALAGMNAPGSARAVELARRIQQDLGDWHDEEVLCETMLKMVADAGFLEEYLELAVETEKLVLGYRRRQSGFEQKFLGAASASFDELKGWCDLLALLAPAEADSEEQRAAAG